MSEPERISDPLKQLVERVVTLDEPESRVARRAFLERVERERPRGTRGPFSSGPGRLGFPLAAVLVAAAVAFFFLRGPKPLEFVVEGAKSEGGYVRVADDRPASIVFSDETRILAASGAALRIDDEESVHGARVSVEGGRLSASVTHTGQSNWRFVAGPFQVRVTGTRFELAWDAERERLEVELHEGSVEIEGYEGSGKLDVRAGQRFVGDARAKTMLVGNLEASSVGVPEERSEEADLDDPAPDVSARAETTTKDGDGVAPGASARSLPVVRESWANQVSKGAFGRVVAAAEERGIEGCLAGCSLADLSALADAARYVGRAELAEKALRALRARDARGSGSRAAFLLGRSREGRGDAKGARSWYETALRESPSGPFAAEALAGRMRTTQALSGARAARPIAEEYLRRYPNGVHAPLARQLAGKL